MSCITRKRQRTERTLSQRCKKTKMETGDKKRKIEKGRGEGRGFAKRKISVIKQKRKRTANKMRENNDGITAREEKEMHITEQ